MFKNAIPVIPVMYDDLSAREILNIIEILRDHNICTEFTWDKSFERQGNHAGQPTHFRNGNSLYIKSHANTEACDYIQHDWENRISSTSIIKIKDNKTEIFRRPENRLKKEIGFRNDMIDEVQEIEAGYKKKFLKLAQKKENDNKNDKALGITGIFLSYDLVTAIVVYLNKNYKSKEVTTEILEMQDRQ